MKKAWADGQRNPVAATIDCTNKEMHAHSKTYVRHFIGSNVGIQGDREFVSILCKWDRVKVAAVSSSTTEMQMIITIFFSFLIRTNKALNRKWNCAISNKLTQVKGTRARHAAKWNRRRWPSSTINESITSIKTPQYNTENWPLCYIKKRHIKILCFFASFEWIKKTT